MTFYSLAQHCSLSLFTAANKLRETRPYLPIRDNWMSLHVISSQFTWEVFVTVKIFFFCSFFKNVSPTPYQTNTSPYTIHDLKKKKRINLRFIVIYLSFPFLD